eukprot:UN1371
MDIGKKFVQLYFSEFADAKGRVDLRQDLNFLKTKHLLEAAGGKTKEVQKMFDMMDTDNSNSVDYVEIVAYFCSHGIGSIQEKASFFFHACDVDGSHTIEKPELKNVVHHMMILKSESQGKDSFIDWNRTLYADVPETYVLHYLANELVADVFAHASKGGEELTEKEFQKWLMRGGKLVNRLTALFNKLASAGGGWSLSRLQGALRAVCSGRPGNLYDGPFLFEQL